jgi:hypothetical protein
LQKVHVENFPEKIDKIFDVRFSSTSVVLSRFRVFLSDGSSKTLQKTFCKKVVSKSFSKKIDKKSKTVFSRFVLSRFWAFLDEGSLKNKIKKKIGGKTDQPWYFLASEEPTNHGVRRFFFDAPCVFRAHPAPPPAPR